MAENKDISGKLPKNVAWRYAKLQATDRLLTAWSLVRIRPGEPFRHETANASRCRFMPEFPPDAAHTSLYRTKVVEKKDITSKDFGTEACFLRPFDDWRFSSPSLNQGAFSPRPNDWASRTRPLATT